MLCEVIVNKPPLLFDCYRALAKSASLFGSNQRLSLVFDTSPLNAQQNNNNNKKKIIIKIVK